MVNFKNGTFYASGRIDSTTAPQFREELNDAFGMQKVRIDFGGVEYISSAGLRVLMALLKTHADVSVVNVNREVCEVFHVTGFTEMMNVSAALREVSVEGCPVIGKGGTGTVYKTGDDMIVKVYSPDMSPENIGTEREFAKKSFLLGLPTAIPFDIVKVGSSYGTCFELLNAVSLGKAFQLYPARREELLQKYVDLIRLIQTTEDKKQSFQSIKSVLTGRCEKLRGFFPDEQLDLAEAFTACMPDSDSLVHGDLHTGNVMLQDDELVIIDMADMTRGPQIYDMLCLYRDLYYACSDPHGKDQQAKRIDLPAEMGVALWFDLARRVYGSDEEVQKVMAAYALLNEVNTFTMCGVMPRSFLEPYKDYIVGRFQAAVAGHEDQIREGFAALEAAALLDKTETAKTAA